MKAVIFSIIGRVIALALILAFVFGVVYITSNTKFLWLLFLIFCIDYVPIYESKTKYSVGD